LGEIYQYYKNTILAIDALTAALGEMKNQQKPKLLLATNYFYRRVCQRQKIVYAPFKKKRNFEF